MDIMINHEYVELSFNELKALVSGNYTMHKCPVCFGKGWYWVDPEGNLRGEESPKDGDDWYQHRCEFDDNECGGLGFKLVFKDQ